MSVVPPEPAAPQPASRPSSQPAAPQPASRPASPPPSQPAARPARRRAWRSRPAVVGAAALVVVLLIVGTSGLRTWWAHRVHDVTHASRPADFAIGLVIGLLPLIGVAAGSLGRRGHRRVLRMLGWGAAGFVATFLLSPAPSTYARHAGVVDTFHRVAPGYLTGVVTAEVAWLVAAAVAVLRVRRWRRRRFPR